MPLGNPSDWCEMGAEKWRETGAASSNSGGLQSSKYFRCFR